MAVVKSVIIDKHMHVTDILEIWPACIEVFQAYDVPAGSDDRLVDAVPSDKLEQVLQALNDVASQLRAMDSG